jgi:uncharacterized membrane protein (Fun14 family)
MDIAGSFNAFIEWLKALWAKVNIQEWAESIGGSSADAIRAVIYFGVGFAVGFLFKRYFKFLLGSVLAALILILFLYYNKILDIDWEALNLFLGLEPTADFGVLLNNIFEWIKLNLLMSISSAVGFLIGYKLG